MKQRILLDYKHIDLVLNRLCHQLIEVHNNFSDTVILGIQKKGVPLAKRIHQKVSEILNKKDIPCGHY